VPWTIVDDVVFVRTHALVGVVAGDPIMARTALASLRPTWDVPPAPSNDDLEEFLRDHPMADAGGWLQSGHTSSRRRSNRGLRDGGAAP